MINAIKLQNDPGVGKSPKAEMLDTIKHIQDETESYMKKAGIRSMVLGISGGIDSALTAALLRPVADKLGIPLIGRYIHIETNSEEENDRANLIGQFCTEYAEIDLSSQFLVMKELDDLEITVDNGAVKYDHTAFKIRMGNIKARMRMIHLYNLASRNNGLVLSTDNLSEFNIGFWTLAGDIGDFGAIQQLWKTEVYALADFIQQNMELVYPDDHEELHKGMHGLIQCIDADATDGLGITKTDLDQITDKRFTSSQEGYRYVDDVLIAFLNNPLAVLDGKIIARHLATNFKRDWPYVIDRSLIFKK